MAKDAKKQTIGEMVRGCVMEPGEQWVEILESWDKTVDDLTLADDEIQSVRSTAGALAAFARLMGRRRDHARLAALAIKLRDRHYELASEGERQWLKANERAWAASDDECGAVFAVWCDLRRVLEARGLTWRAMMISGFPDDAKELDPLSKAAQRRIISQPMARSAPERPKAAERPTPVACGDCRKTGVFITKDGRCTQCERDHRAAAQRVERLHDAASPRLMRRSA